MKLVVPPDGATILGRIVGVGMVGAKSPLARPEEPPEVGLVRDSRFCNNNIAVPGKGQRREPTMCGRFPLTTPIPVLAEWFLFPEAAPQPPRYNIAPTQAVAAVRATAEAGAREGEAPAEPLAPAGLVPPA